MPDGERWICNYDPDFDDYFWEPAAPTTADPLTDGIVWDTKDNRWAAPDGITHRTTARVEFIQSTVRTGVDTYTRQPVTSPLTEPAGDIGVFSYLDAWNGAQWSLCETSGWAYSAAAQSFYAKTFNWGLGPCGYVWYANVGFVAHWDAATSSWQVSPQANSSGATAQYAGTTAYAGAGFGAVLDPPPAGAQPAAPTSPPPRAPSPPPPVPGPH